MKIHFYPAGKPLKGHLADVQLIFEEAGLRGLSLSGISLWQRGEGQGGIVVSLPYRSFGEGGTGRYHFLRGDQAAVDKLRDTIVAAFLRQHPQLSRALVSRSTQGTQRP
jgi:hypothetical protein